LPELTLCKLAVVIVLKFPSETFHHALHIPTNQLGARHTRAASITIAPRSKISPSVVRAWTVTVFASLLRSHCAQAFTTLCTTLNTMLASRLNCTHCIFTAISWIALHAKDTFTTSKQCTSSLNYALSRSWCDLSRSDHELTALTTTI